MKSDNQYSDRITERPGIIGKLSPRVATSQNNFFKPIVYAKTSQNVKGSRKLTIRDL